MKNYLKFLLLAIVVVCYIVGCSNVRQEGNPDVVSSISSNRDYKLIVVANRREIINKVEFAKLLIQMSKRNAFETIKFSVDQGYATSLEMDVYLWEDEVRNREPVMTVKYDAEDYLPGYNIIDDSEKFELYVDEELV